MADYAKLNQETIEKILALYGISDAFQYQALSLGISNSNYKISTSDRNFLLKVSNDKDQTQLLSEQKILHYLHEKNFPFSIVPLQTTSRELLYRIGTYFGVLYPFVEGIPPGPNDVTCFEIGQALAKMHSIPTDSGLRNYSQVGHDLKKIYSFSKSNECPPDFKESFNRHLWPKFAQLKKLEIHQSIIHGDLYYDNTLFHNNHLEAILDFEQAGIGARTLDLGISIGGTCLEKGRIIYPLIRSYLKGYQSVISLAPEELTLLPECIMTGLLSISLWRIDRFMVKDLDLSMRTSYRELLNRAQYFSELPSEDL